LSIFVRLLPKKNLKRTKTPSANLVIKMIVWDGVKSYYIRISKAS
jgi:hypothetical protein